MATFTDRLGQTWSLEITAWEIKQVRKTLGINLWDAFADDYRLYSEVVGDVEKLVSIAYVLCQEQIRERGLSEEGFGKAMAGDSLRALGDAFTEALIAFFPNARAREAVRATLSKAQELLELRAQMTQAIVAALPIASLLAPPSAGSTNSPESPPPPATA